MAAAQRVVMVSVGGEGKRSVGTHSGVKQIIIAVRTTRLRWMLSPGVTVLRAAQVDPAGDPSSLMVRRVHGETWKAAAVRRGLVALKPVMPRRATSSSPGRRHRQIGAAEDDFRGLWR